MLSSHFLGAFRVARGNRVSKLSPGSVLGELALMNDQPRRGGGSNFDGFDGNTSTE